MRNEPDRLTQARARAKSVLACGVDTGQIIEAAAELRSLDPFDPLVPLLVDKVARIRVLRRIMRVSLGPAGGVAELAFRRSA